MGNQVRSILVAVATYRRPAELRQLLESLRLQRLEPFRNMQVVVVDNDNCMSAQEVCREFSAFVSYDYEPVPGIAQARNRGLLHLTGADAVAFIDDDETAHSEWLENLALAAERYGADVVAGPVVPVFPADAPRWIVRQGWFHRRRYQTGEDVRWPATNNSLIRTQALLRLNGCYFDERYGLTGGEDAEFYMRCRELGSKVVWSENAVVAEVVPRSRLTARWLWRRNLRLGNISAAMLRQRYPAYIVFVVGIGRVFVGLSGALPAVLFWRPWSARILAHVPRGIGVVAVAVGAKPIVEYARGTEN